MGINSRVSTKQGGGSKSRKRYETRREVKEAVRKLRRREARKQEREKNPEDAWKTLARAYLASYKRDISSMMRWLGLSGNLAVTYGGTPDIASIPSEEPPRVIIGPKWASLAIDDDERRKRFLHELVHCATGMEHGKSSRLLGFYSKPSRDQFTREMYTRWLLARALGQT